MYDNRTNYTLDQVPIIENVQNTKELLSLTNDKDDEKIFGFCYEIGLATRELIKDSKFASTMVALAKENPIPVVYLMDLEQDAPEYFRIINENLAEKNLSLEYIKENMTHRPILPNPEFPETAELEHYEPAIFIPNLKQVDTDKQVLLSPKVVTDGDKNPELEDYIVTWYYTEAGDLREILVSEETSLKTTNPLFIIDNAQRFEKNQIVLGGDSQVEPPRDNNITEDRSIIRFDSKELKIKTGYRYEPTAKS